MTCQQVYFDKVSTLVATAVIHQCLASFCITHSRINHNFKWRENTAYGCYKKTFIVICGFWQHLLTKATWALLPIVKNCTAFVLEESEGNRQNHRLYFFCKHSCVQNASNELMCLFVAMYHQYHDIMMVKKGKHCLNETTGVIQK